MLLWTTGIQDTGTITLARTFYLSSIDTAGCASTLYEIQSVRNFRKKDEQTMLKCLFGYIKRLENKEVNRWCPTRIQYIRF